jgi:Holliday junction resolvasome RuvABC endonuclease subunit
MNKYIYGFDLSMDCTGVSIFDTKGNPIFVTSIQTNKKHSHGFRLKQIADVLLELKEKYPTNIISIERGFARFNTSTQVIYRVHGLANYLFYDCEQIYYPPKKVKEAIYKGDATKKQIQDKILTLFPSIKFQNEDESDSFAVGLTYFIKEKNINFNKLII